MSDKVKEWLKQADYDMETADAMFVSGRYFYAVFMCHLSIEKALKGVFCRVMDETPPKTHNLLFLLNRSGKKIEEKMEKFIIKLNTASVGARYPDELEKIQAAYTKEITQDLIRKSKEVLAWIKTQL
jgi:HEPN domain-containing protein